MVMVAMILSTFRVYAVAEMSLQQVKLGVFLSFLLEQVLCKPMIVLLVWLLENLNRGHEATVLVLSSFNAFLLCALCFPLKQNTCSVFAAVVDLKNAKKQ